MVHLLNPLPDLLVYSIWAPMILRVTVGYFLLSFGKAKFFATMEESTPPSVWWKIIGVVEFVVGLALIVGFGVQIDAIIAILIILGIMISYNKINFPRKQSPQVYWLLLLIAFSLLLTGAGLPAIDLPL